VLDGSRVSKADHTATLRRWEQERGRSDSSRRLPSTRSGCIAAPKRF